MDQNKNSNEKVIKKSNKNDDIKVNKDIKTNYDIPKPGDPNFSWHHHIIEGRKELDELDSIFGF